MQHPQPARRDPAAQLAAEQLDLLIVGGGIVGAGIARDAALRGLRVGLVEQHDLAFGTSSRSSRLLHGGIRYLAQGRIGLVYQASREKRVLHRIAPHLAEPLAFIFPSYRGTGWPLWKLRVGVKLYDLLCGGENFGPSEPLTRQRTLQELPGLAPENLAGAVRYYDGLTSDSRLVLDTLRSAARHGAVVANYTRLEDAQPQAGRWRCRLCDLIGQRWLEIETRTVVNAAGPWAQTLPHAAVRLRLTKGVHLVIDRGRLPVPAAVVMTDGRRILFAIPWQRRVILGTTDTDYEGAPEGVQTEAADAAYILEVTNRHFPAARLSLPDVRASWAGLRPLIAQRGGRPSDISRAHQIRMPKPGWFDVAGGKLTTYRLIAEQVVDRLVRYLGLRAAPCRTAQQPLLEPEAVRGTSSIVPPEPTPELVAHFCREEWAVHLEDIMLRRTAWHYYCEDRQELAGRVARWMSPLLGWDAQRIRAEQAQYRQALQPIG
ncbi:MAG: glycerol-3-phosphate dehydrogenase/oxidase [Thermoguttaceae bacterium]